jgi:hypothetical protein
MNRWLVFSLATLGTAAGGLLAYFVYSSQVFVSTEASAIESALESETEEPEFDSGVLGLSVNDIASRESARIDSSFILAAIQALRAVPGFSEFFETLEHRNPVLHPVVATLSDLFKDMAGMVPGDFADATRLKTVFLEWIQQSQNGDFQIHPRVVIEMLCKHLGSFERFKNRFAFSAIQGSLCPHCRAKSESTSRAYVLITEEDVIQTLCSTFAVAVPGASCSRCGCPDVANKFFFENAPEVFIIQIVTSSPEPQAKFPLKKLDLGPFILDSHSTSETRYDLVSSCQEIGKNSFVTLARSKTGKWFGYDGIHVAQVAKSKIADPLSTLLVYVRRDVLYPPKTQAVIPVTTNGS